MTAIFILISILGGFFLDWLIASWAFAPLLLLPVGVLAALFWLQRLNFTQRIIYALCMGWVLDSLSLVPFGTSLLLFFFLALLVHPLRRLFENRTSWLQQLIFTGVLYVLFLVLAPLIGRGLSFIGMYV